MSNQTPNFQGLFFTSRLNFYFYSNLILFKARSTRMNMTITSVSIHKTQITVNQQDLLGLIFRNFVYT